MTLVITRATKQAARYTDAGGRERCSGCRFFMPQGTCGRIIGPVSPKGWCKYYSQEAVQRWQPQGAPIAHGGPTLALDFLSPGAMPAGITFARAGSATYFDANGTMQTATANAPRWDYDPATHALRGLLVENFIQNLLLQSANFSTSWGTNAVTVTTGQGGAPDGTASFNRLAETTSTNIFFLSQNQAIIASTNYTLSVFARAAQNRYLQLALDNGGADGGYATFDLLTGTISGALTARGAGVIGVASVQAIGGGTYRCAISTSIGPSVSGRILIVLSNVPAPPFAPSYAGNAANGLLIWGAQLETPNGPYTTSYIPTTTAQVTRTVDQCSMPIGAWFTPATYSLAFEFDVPLIAQTYGGISDNSLGANTSRFTSGNFDFAGNVATGTALTAGAISKQCAAVSNTAFVKVSNNGGAVATTAINIAAQTGAIRLAFGNDPWTLTTAFNGHMRSARYWPRVLSDTELRAAST